MVFFGKILCFFSFWAAAASEPDSPEQEKNRVSEAAKRNYQQNVALQPTEAAFCCQSPQCKYALRAGGWD